MCTITIPSSMDDDRADEGFGDDEFISHNDFYDTTLSCRYIKNDNIFFQVTFISASSYTCNISFKFLRL